MANKKTVVQMYEEILQVAGLTDEQRAFIEKRIEITKKKNANRSAEPTPKQREKMEQDERFKQAIANVMEANVAYTPSDLVKLIDIAEITSTQKITPLLTAMVNDGVLTKATVKGRSVYSLSADNADED